MKKKGIVFILICLQYTVTLISFEVHVIPLYKEHLTGDWCGLFGRDAGKSWSTFKCKATDHDDMLAQALNALKKQTNGIYDLTYEKIKQKHAVITLNNKDVVFCFPITYMPSPLLHKKMTKSLEQDCTKDSFMWIPMSEIVQHVNVRRVAYGKTMNYKFDIPTRMIISQNWDPKLKPQLNAAVNLYANQKCLAKKTVQKKMYKKELKLAERNAQTAVLQKIEAQKNKVQAAAKRNLRIAEKRSFRKA